MYPKFDCKVITDEANYYFDIFEEENNTADHNAVEYVLAHFPNEGLIGGSSRKNEGIKQDEKSLDLVKREKDKKTFLD